MGSVNAELHRRNAAGELVAWLLNDDGTSPVADATARQHLADLLDTLQGVLDVSGSTVGLSAATLGALETVDVGNLPATFPLPAVQVDTLTPQTDGLTDTELRAAAVDVNDGHDQPLTDDELRAAAVATTVGNLPADWPDAGAHTRLDGILGQLDDDTADTVLSVLKQLADVDYATETTLDLIRQHTEAVNANTDTLEQLLTTLKDNQLRRSDPLAAGDNRIGYVTDSIVQRVSDAQSFIGGAHRISVASGDALWLVMSNPADSGVDVLIGGVTVYTDSNETVWVDVFRDTVPDPAADGLTPWTTNFPAAELGVASAVALSHHDVVSDAGVQLDAGAGLTRRAPWPYKGMPILVGPGQQGAARVEVPGGLTGGAAVSANMIWVEVPA